MKNNKIALIVAKILAVCAFCAVFLLLIAEVMSMCMYGIPLLTVQIARLQGVGAGADWVIGGTLWLLPALFLVLILSWVHIVMIRKITMRMWHFMLRVLRKS